MPESAPEVPAEEAQFVRRAKIADYAAPAYFADGMTHTEIAAALAAEEGGKPLSVQKIKQIERNALRKVRRILAARGITTLSEIVP